MDQNQAGKGVGSVTEVAGDSAVLHQPQEQQEEQQEVQQEGQQAQKQEQHQLHSKGEEEGFQDTVKGEDALSQGPALCEWEWQHSGEVKWGENRWGECEWGRSEGRQRGEPQGCKTRALCGLSWCRETIGTLTLCLS